MINGKPILSNHTTGKFGRTFTDLTMRQFKFTKYWILCCTLLLSLSLQAWAQKGEAGQPGEFLRYGVGGRAMGMGQAFVGLADDANAVYWNPAGLIAAPRAQFTSMYANLYLDSRYNFIGLVLPRQIKHFALGFGWVNWGMSGFEQRSATNNILLGNFDFREQAFIMAAAREWVGTWGILNYGLSLKAVNQAFPGLVGYSETGDWGLGADFGITFRPIHAPLFRLLPLRWLMPLQLGFVAQNLVPPRIKVGSGEADIYPRVFRWGLSYALITGDWRFNWVLDQEAFHRRRLAWFSGLEINRAIEQSLFAARFGYNSLSDAPSMGGGIIFNQIKAAAIRIDLAYAFKPHESLRNDLQVFFGVDFGRHYGARYFLEQAEETQRIKNRLQALIRYQENCEAAVESAERLASFDFRNEERYVKFIGGPRAVNYLYDKVWKISSEQADDENIDKTLKREAAKLEDYEQAPVPVELGGSFWRNAHYYLKNNLQRCAVQEAEDAAVLLDDYYLKKAELNYISGNCSEALGFLARVRQMPRIGYFIAGLCYEKRAMWDSAVSAYRQAVDAKDPDERNIKALALLGLSRSMKESAKYQEALDMLDMIAQKSWRSLASDYFKPPVYRDKEGYHCIADEALLIAADCCRKLGYHDKEI
ncbi:MAG: hypothetical protein ONA69_08860, partial [candidate division KSB1 bacterium]|nr:hypothetical protein [candidate division KSB1 bacterium]